MKLTHNFQRFKQTEYILNIFSIKYTYGNSHNLFFILNFTKYILCIFSRDMTCSTKHPTLLVLTHIDHNRLLDLFVLKFQLNLLSPWTSELFSRTLSVTVTPLQKCLKITQLLKKESLMTVPKKTQVQSFVKFSINTTKRNMKIQKKLIPHLNKEQNQKIRSQAKQRTWLISLLQ